MQQQTDKILQKHYAYAKAYINNIIIFFKTLAEYLKHLQQVFTTLQDHRVVLRPKKSFLEYSSVSLLNQWVNSLGMSTSAEKIRAIQIKHFPADLHELEMYLGLTRWLQSSIPQYTQIAKPLQKLKTKTTQKLSDDCHSNKMKRPTHKAQTAKISFNNSTTKQHKFFQRLQKAFAQPIFFYHFDWTCWLFFNLNASKKWGFEAMIYHIREDPDPDQIFNWKNVQPILYLSKLFNKAEQNYWPTELEMAALVWTVKKIHHMIESNKSQPVITYTDHTASVNLTHSSTLSTSFCNKLNLHLIQASQYLSLFPLNIQHKSDSTNTVPDALSQLKKVNHEWTEDSAAPGTLKVLCSDTDEFITDILMIYNTTLIEVDPRFKRKLIIDYIKDQFLQNLLPILKQKASTGNLQFTLNQDLIYYINNFTQLNCHCQWQLCILQNCYPEVLKMAHDDRQHAGVNCTINHLYESIYIYQMTKHIQQYIKHCPDCHKLQIRRHQQYGKLNPIVTPPEPFHTVAMDFIVKLLKDAGFDCLATITCKFSKVILLVPDKTTWKAQEWADVMIQKLLRKNWSIPAAFISDHNAKFMSTFWHSMFKALDVMMLTSITYHPQTDSQLKWTN